MHLKSCTAALTKQIFRVPELLLLMSFRPILFCLWLSRAPPLRPPVGNPEKHSSALSVSISVSDSSSSSDNSESVNIGTSGKSLSVAESFRFLQSDNIQNLSWFQYKDLKGIFTCDTIHLIINCMYFIEGGSTVICIINLGVSICYFTRPQVCQKPIICKATLCHFIVRYFKVGGPLFRSELKYNIECLVSLVNLSTFMPIFSWFLEEEMVTFTN